MGFAEGPVCGVTSSERGTWGGWFFAGSEFMLAPERFGAPVSYSNPCQISDAGVQGCTNVISDSVIDVTLLRH